MTLTFWVLLQFFFVVVGLGYLMTVARRQLDVLEQIKRLLEKQQD